MKKLYSYEEKNLGILTPKNNNPNEEYYISYITMGFEPINIPFNNDGVAHTPEECNVLIKKLVAALDDEIIREEIRDNFEALQKELQDMTTRFSNPMLTSVDKMLQEHAKDYNSYIAEETNSVNHFANHTFDAYLRIYGLLIIKTMLQDSRIPCLVFVAKEGSYDTTRFHKPPIACIISHSSIIYELDGVEIDLKKEIFDDIEQDYF